MATWDSTFNASPPESQDHGRGGERIRETRDETRRRLAFEHDAGDSTASGHSSYSDDGRHSPGSARAFVANHPVSGGKPTTILTPDGAATVPGASTPTGASTAITAAADVGRLWIDDAGTIPYHRYLTGVAGERWAAPMGYRNHLINGSFLVQQRQPLGAATCPVATTTYAIDRWYVNPAGAGCTATRGTGTAGGPGIAGNSNAGGAMFLNFTDVAMTSMVFGTRLENQILLTLGARLNFSAKCWNSGTGVNLTFRVRVFTPNASNDFSATTLQSESSDLVVASGSVAFISHSFNAAAYTNGLQIEVRVTPAAGVAAGAAIFEQMLLEFGWDRSKFYPEPTYVEYPKCLRYFERSYTDSTNTGSAAVNGAIYTSGVSAGTGTTIHLPFKMPKRNNSSTVTIYNPNSGASGSARDYTAGADRALVGTTSNLGGLGIDPRGQMGSSVVVASSAVNGAVVGCHFTVDNELY